MAAVCVMCKMLCVLILLISSLLSVYSSSDIYLYDTSQLQPPIKEYLSVVLNDGEHFRLKRQTDQLLSQNDSKTTQIPTNIQPTVKPSTKPVILTNHTLVGVNGTGIRKYNNSNIDNHDVSTLPPTTVKSENVSSLSTVNAVENANTLNKTKEESKEDDDEISISNFSEEAVNKTLLQNNITKTEYDSHQYYNSTFTIDPEIGQKYWVDMRNRTDVKVNELLSQSHRRAATVKLSFDFPFYGHIVRNVTIATGGFLYTGEYVHSWLAATQYIAPLMANFDTSLSNDSYIKYVDNGTAFTVQWEKVSLQDKPNDGDFTFQATLHQSGDIVFVYKSVPVIIENIQDDHHPVKVGLSDAYIIDRTIFFVRRKTIYEYHRVNFKREDIKNWTVIYLSALPTCLSNKDCISCVSKPTSSFQCTWCPTSKRCSNGMDRYRQDWLMKGCERKQIKNETMCSYVDTSDVSTDIANHTSADEASAHYDPILEHHRPHVDDPRQASRITNDVNIMHADKPPHMGVSGIITILVLISLVVGLSVWLMYAYRNPHSASGQILIRYRPSQWSWKRGEARYTAATIHM